MPTTLPDDPSFLPEAPEWEDALYQIETDDPVVGGPDGISNIHARQLGNRTRWLKDLVEGTSTALAAHEAGNNHPLATTAAKGMVVLSTVAEALAGAANGKPVTPDGLAAALASLVDSSPATLNTLNELAAALGDDPNFATTITTLLATKAPLESPALTGAPTAPTAPAGTGTDQIATTAFVLGAIAALEGYAQLAVAQSFTKAQRGAPAAWADDGSTIAMDFANGNNFNGTLAGARTIAAPSNLVAGQGGEIEFTMVGGPFTPAWNVAWDFGADGAPDFSDIAADGSVTVAYYYSGAKLTARRIW